MPEGRGSIEKELQAAIAAGEAPEFQVLAFDLRESILRMGGGKDHRCSVTLNIVVDGQPVLATVGAPIRSARSGLAYAGRLGPVDLMEKALRDALASRWPKMKQYLQGVQTTSYAVHAIGDAANHHVQVHLGVVLAPGEKQHRISREGVSTIGVTFDALMTIYHWAAWRLSRRLRWEEKKGKKS